MGKEQQILFIFDSNCKLNENLFLNPDYEILEFVPTIFRLKLDNFYNIKDFFKHVLWFLSTKGKYKIVYVVNNKKIIHYSYVIPKFYKFSFLAENDLEIGPCYTQPDYRGIHIFPYIIAYIINKYRNHNNFIMVVDGNNINSQKGIQKAGLRKYGIVNKNIFGIHKITEIFV